MKTILQSLRAIIVLTILTGALYPLIVTGLSRVAFPTQAAGSQVSDGDKAIGSALLAQKFEKPEYFWSRPSDADYATVASGASNKGPTSADLVKSIEERHAKFGADAPDELLTASGSGLDPHLSPAAAKYQTARGATARKLSESSINALIDSQTEGPQLGIFGEARVNVLALNRALDGLK